MSLYIFSFIYHCHHSLLGTTDPSTLAIWAADCAEHVLYWLEEKNPGDQRPREAIAAARSWARGELKAGEARSSAFAAHAAATAHVSGHAIHAAAYAAKAMPGEGPWQYQRLVELRGEE